MNAALQERAQGIVDNLTPTQAVVMLIYLGALFSANGDLDQKWLDSVNGAQGILVEKDPHASAESANAIMDACAEKLGATLPAEVVDDQESPFVGVDLDEAVASIQNGVDALGSPAIGTTDAEDSLGFVHTPCFELFGFECDGIEPDEDEVEAFGD